MAQVEAVQMREQYPFGEFKGTAQALEGALVLKKLTYRDEGQRKII
jgi:hypothetical protein